MPDPDPSAETRFQKGRAKTGGRQKGTPNKPKSIRIAMREFADQEGDALLAFAHHVLYELPDIMPVDEKGHVSTLPAKVSLFIQALRYGIGLPAKQAQDGGHNTVQIVLRHPPGTDPVALRAAQEAAADRKELPRGAAPARRDIAPRPLTKSIMQAARAMPQVIMDPDDPSLELEPVTDHDLPDDPAMTIHEGDMR